MDKITALRILKNSLILDLGVTRDVPVIKITTTNPENGEPFVWENSKDNYAVVEFKAMNKTGADKASKMLKAGDFENSCKNYLTARVSLKKAEKLQQSMCATVELVQFTKKNGELIDVVKTVVPYDTEMVNNPIPSVEILNEQTGAEERELILDIFSKNPKLIIDLISCNYALTIEMLYKFKDKLNWELLSSNANLEWSDELIELFDYKWDWDKLIENKKIKMSVALIQKYEIINNINNTINV